MQSTVEFQPLREEWTQAQTPGLQGLRREETKQRAEGGGTEDHYQGKC